VRVSVAVTNHNYGRYVGAAIESVLAQTRPADQIVVVDDGSTDDSLSVIGRYTASVTLVATPNRGVVAATNEALAHCDGEVVAMLDADDLLLPERLESLLAAYESEADVQWVFNGVQRIDRSSQRPLPTPRIGHFRTGRYDVRGEIARGFVSLGTPPSSGLSFRRSLIAEVLPIPEGIGNQDTFLALSAMARAAGYVVKGPLTLYGIHESNRFSTTTGSARERYMANHYVSMATGYDALGVDLHALADSFAARALTGSRMGLRLAPAQRDRLRAHLRTLGTARKARVAGFVLKRAFFQSRRRLLAPFERSQRSPGA
jgi:exopolysaccharide biosynthesis glycosyltransferase PssF